MKILIKYHKSICELEKHGDWIDMKSSEDVDLKKFENKLISLGVSMKLPKYFESNLVPRSGTYGKYGIIQANHMGVIDGPNDKTDGYSGNGDVWMFNAIALKNCHINAGDRICQFKIVPTMSAPWYAKLRWIFDNKIKFVVVDDLTSENRGGFGKSGR